MRKLNLFGLIVILCVWFVPNIVMACSCRHPETVSAVVEGTSIIFEGVLVNSETPKTLKFGEYPLAKFEVTKIYKGKDIQQIVYLDTSANTSCSVNFKPNEKNLIFAYLNEKTQVMSTGSCSKSYKFTDANYRNYLDNGVDKRVKKTVNWNYQGFLYSWESATYLSQCKSKEDFLLPLDTKVNPLSLKKKYAVRVLHDQYVNALEKAKFLSAEQLYYIGKGYEKPANKKRTSRFLFTLAYMKMSADRGYSDAQFQIGNIVENCRFTVLRDIDLAVDYYQKAAAQGHVQAQARLGHIYSDPLLELYDKEKAQSYIRLCKDNNKRGYCDASARVSQYRKDIDLDDDREFSHHYKDIVLPQIDENKALLKRLDARLRDNP